MVSDHRCPSRYITALERHHIQPLYKINPVIFGSCRKSSTDLPDIAQRQAAANFRTRSRVPQRPNLAGLVDTPRSHWGLKKTLRGLITSEWRVGEAWSSYDIIMGLKGVFTNAADLCDSSSKLFIQRLSSKTTWRLRRFSVSIWGNAFAPAANALEPDSTLFRRGRRSTMQHHRRVRPTWAALRDGGVEPHKPRPCVCLWEMCCNPRPWWPHRAPSARRHRRQRRPSASTPAGSHWFCFVAAFPRRWSLSYGWRSHRVGHAPRLEA